MSPLAFDRPVPDGGYVWWYVDALSEDGRHGLTIIAFIGSVFSPYYAWARRRGQGGALADPLNHCALNVALYGRSGKRWAMTERGRSAVSRSASQLTIGPSSIRWAGDTLEIHIDERAVPMPRHLRGVVRVRPAAVTDAAFTLDAEGQHVWRPIAPLAAVEVDMTSPSLRWSGPGYLDSNSGETPLEAAFTRWTWSRASVGSDAAILYDVQRRPTAEGLVPDLSLALRIDARGSVSTFDPPPEATLSGTLWRVDRTTRAEPGAAPRVLETLEDAPFYARTVIETRLLGETATAVHESLSLDRFRKPWVQMMLPFRMPRLPAGRSGSGSG